MPVKIWNDNISKLFLWNTPVTGAYLGDERVFGKNWWFIKGQISTTNYPQYTTSVDINIPFSMDGGNYLVCVAKFSWSDLHGVPHYAGIPMNSRTYWTRVFVLKNPPQWSHAVTWNTYTNGTYIYSSRIVLFSVKGLNLHSIRTESKYELSRTWEKTRGYLFNVFYCSPEYGTTIRSATTGWIYSGDMIYQEWCYAVVDPGEIRAPSDMYMYWVDLNGYNSSTDKEAFQFLFTTE